MQLPRCESGVTGTIQDRFDGAQWTTLETPEALYVVTSVGKVALENVATLNLMQEYLDEAMGESDTKGKVRRYLAEGGNAQVYTVGDAPFVVKEKRAHSKEDLLPGLERLDHISNAVESFCPRWIDVAAHHAVVLPHKDPNRQFLLMDKIDHGVTVGDIQGIANGERPREQHLVASAYEAFGDIDDGLAELVTKQHKLMQESLQDAMYSQGLAPDSYLTDIRNVHNTIVEPLQTPVGGSRLRMTVIDQ